MHRIGTFFAFSGKFIDIQSSSKIPNRLSISSILFEKLYRTNPGGTNNEGELPHTSSTVEWRGKMYSDEK